VGIARSVRRASGPSPLRGSCWGMGSAWSARVAGWRPAGAHRRSVRRTVMGATRGRGPAACGAGGARVEPSGRAVLGGVSRGRGIAACSSCPIGGLGTARRFRTGRAVRPACDCGSIVGHAGRACVGRPEDRGTGRSTRSVMGSPRRATAGLGNPRRARSGGREAIGGERPGCTLERSGRGCLVGSRPRRARGSAEHGRRAGRRIGWRVAARAVVHAGTCRAGCGRRRFTTLDAERAQGAGFCRRRNDGAAAAGSWRRGRRARADDPYACMVAAAVCSPSRARDDGHAGEAGACRRRPAG
jgi:hypothetical protein